MDRPHSRIIAAHLGGPARRPQTGCAVQRGDREAAVVGDGREKTGTRGRERLGPRVAREVVGRLSRFSQTESDGVGDLQTGSLEQRP